MKFHVVFAILLMCAIANHHCFIPSRIQQFLSSSNEEQQYKPIELHLAFTNIDNELIVNWHTNDYDESLLGKPLVKYSTTDASLSRSYQVASLGSIISQYGEVYHTGYDMAIKLSNLQYATKYYYQVSFVYGNVSSDIYYFYTKTDPKSAQSYETTVVMYGDQGILRSSHDIAQVEGFVHDFLDTSANKNLFIYHLGDISYGRL